MTLKKPTNNKDMKPKFKKVVDAGDLVGTRLFLANEMMLDPRGDSFLEMRTYAESKFVNLYVDHNGISFETDREKWDEDLLFSVKNELDSNFSRERIDYYFELAKYVLKDKAANLDAEERRSAAHHTTTPVVEENYSSGINYKDVAIGAGIASGAAMTIAGFFIEKTAVACLVSTIGVLGMAVGGYLLYNESKK